MKGINTPDTTAIDINLKGVSPLPVSRGIAAKRAIERDYLERLNEVYSEFFLYYDDAPLLIANSSELDPANGDADYIHLVDYLLEIHNSRHYFNPTFFG